MQKEYSRSKLVEYIAEQLNKGATRSKLSKQVAAYLIDSGKSSELESVMRDAQDYRANNYGVVELTARTAHETTSEVENKVQKVAKEQYPKTKKVIINHMHDEKAVGGINVLLPHHSLDLTIQNKLNSLREGIL